MNVTPCEPLYVAGPSGRGTIGLLTTCILTLFACVWTAIHLNVFPRDSSWRERFIHKVGWTLLASFAPEVVVWRAISQWESARALRDRHNEILKGKCSEAATPIDNDVNDLSVLFAPPGLWRQIISLWESPPARRDQRKETTRLRHSRAAAPTSNIVNDDVPIVNEEPASSLQPTANDASMSSNDVPVVNQGWLIKEGSAMTVSISKLRLAWRKTLLWCGISNLVARHTPPQDNDRLYWCIEHGFFAVMGGFEVMVNEEGHEWILDDGSIVTPATILILAQLKKIPPVTQLTLRSRGKADHLAKALICMQAGWMALQTIARKVAGLPVTLLELNTLSHVACAVMMYIIWWQKPQNVDETVPIPIELDLATSMSSFRFRMLFTNEAEIAGKEPKSAPPRQKSVYKKCLLAPNILLSYLRLQKRFIVESDIENLEIPTWQQMVPPNTSELEVLGVPRRNWSDERKTSLIKRALKSDVGTVILLPGQTIQVEGIPFRLRDRADPVHLSVNDIERLKLMAAL